MVLGGDIHTFVAGDLKLAPDGPVIASEFVGGSISSLGRSNAAMALLQSANPHLKFGDGEVRGYGLLDLTRETCAVRFRAVESALVPQSPIRNLAAFVVEDGERGLKPA